MKIEEIKNPTQVQFDWADLNMMRLEKKAIRDYPMEILNGTKKELYPLSAVCEAVITNYKLVELFEETK